MKKKKKIIIATIVALMLAFSAVIATGCFFGDNNQTVAVETVSIVGPSSANVNESISFMANVNPTNATNASVSWAISGSNTIGATINNTGVFSATSAGNVTITATAGGVTATHSITVNAIAVNVVRIIGNNTFSYSGHLVLQTEVLPENATSRDVTFELVAQGTTALGAAVSGAIVTATGVGNINVRATSVDGNIQSAIFAIFVTEIPVTNIAITNAGDADFEVYRDEESFSSTSIHNASWRPIDENLTTTRLLTGVTTARTGHNHITIGANGITNGIINRETINVRAGDVIDLSFWARHHGGGGMAGSAMRLNVRYTLNNWEYISNAIVARAIGTAYVQVTSRINITSNGELTLHIFGLSGFNASLSIDDISVTVTSQIPSFTAGETLTLQSSVLPTNATNSSVSFEILPQCTTAAGANIEGNVLTASTAGVIRIRPSTLNFQGTPFYVLAQ